MILDIKSLKKRRILSSLIVLLLLTPCFIWITLKDNDYNAAKASLPIPLVIIDPGHGGVDSGAIAADGSKESDINLAIALKLRALAEFYGIDNLLIRQEDITLSDTASYSEHRDLQCRTDIVNAKENSIYISIHQNCYPTGQASGSLVIYSENDKSEKLGKLTHENLITYLNPDNRRLAEPAGNKFFILSHVECPAILVECGFMSNFSESEKLKSSDYQTSLAGVLIGSFIQYTQDTKYI